MERYKIKHCPVLIIDETRVIAVDGLTEGQLKDLLNLGEAVQAKVSCPRVG